MLRQNNENGRNPGNDIIIKIIYIYLAAVPTTIIYYYIYDKNGGIMDFISRVIAGLVTSGIIFALGYVFRGMRYRKKYANAAEQYVDFLHTLINEAVSAGRSEININAQAIVSTRDDMRKTLSSLSLLLNDDIDKMSKQLLNEVSDEELLITAIVLYKKWPFKKKQIEIELRKLLAEMGFEKE